MIDASARRAETVLLATVLAVAIGVLLELALLVSFGLLAPHAPTSGTFVTGAMRASGFVAVVLAAAAVGFRRIGRAPLMLVSGSATAAAVMVVLLVRSGWTATASGKDSALGALLAMHGLVAVVALVLELARVPGARVWTGFLLAVAVMSALVVGSA